MNIYCNAGVMSTSLVGDLPGYGEVWYHKNGIANILSLACMKKKHRVTYDSENGNSFQVWKSDRSMGEFQELPQGLYYLDVTVEDAGAKQATGIFGGLCPIFTCHLGQQLLPTCGSLLICFELLLSSEAVLMYCTTLIIHHALHLVLPLDS
jgi:hypothetical protein